MAELSTAIMEGNGLSSAFAHSLEVERVGLRGSGFAIPLSFAGAVSVLGCDGDMGQWLQSLRARGDGRTR